jgi:hypothetical protein
MILTSSTKFSRIERKTRVVLFVQVYIDMMFQGIIGVDMFECWL